MERILVDFFAIFLNFSKKVIDQGFIYLQARFVMAHKICFENFCEKAPETLTGDNVGTSYDCFFDLILDFEEALTSFKFEGFD